MGELPPSWWIINKLSEYDFFFLVLQRKSLSAGKACSRVCVAIVQPALGLGTQISQQPGSCLGTSPECTEALWCGKNIRNDLTGTSQMLIYTECPLWFHASIHYQLIQWCGVSITLKEENFTRMLQPLFSFVGVRMPWGNKMCMFSPSQNLGML